MSETGSHLSTVWFEVTDLMVATAFTAALKATG